MSRKDVQAALDAVADEFMKFTWQTEPANPDALVARHERIKNLINAAGGKLDAVEVCHLFYKLEYRASSELGKVAALAQTTEPERLAERGLPSQLIDNAVLLRGHYGRRAKVTSAEHARKGKKDTKDKAAFVAWARAAHSDGHRPDRITDVRNLPGFDAGWSQTPEVQKRWWKEANPGYEFKRGREKTNSHAANK